ncbi:MULTISPECIES: transposase [Neisseria]|uniref:transposase n=1 Tax=Neisseria TaxID=482 RepID=UPI00265B663E|nr:MULTISPECIES: transposase [Neisseria]
MAKYSDEFRLAVVQYYLAGNGSTRTANHFSISDSLVRRWVTRYRLHGESGIKKHTTKYSVEYKLEAIRPVMGQGMSQKAAADQLNLPDCSILLQWLRLYRLNGINGLKPKPKGRKPVKKQHPPQTKKSDYLKTKEELLAELA